MRTWITAAALGAAVLGGFGAIGATAQETGQPAPPPHGGPMMQADANADGVTTRAEVIADADRRFAAMDADRDGKVSDDERRAYRAQRRAADADRPMPPPGADGMPPHGRRRGKMRGPETQAQFREQALRRFDRIDTNHDGRVDAQEREAMELLMRARAAGRHDRGGPPPGETPPPPPPGA